MKIKHKLALSGFLTIGLILLSLAFASHDMNVVVAKLGLVEVTDELQASFLEMRLAEKNYFLFDDATSLDAIVRQTEEIGRTLDKVRPEILSATGREGLRTLRGHLADYARIAGEIGQSGTRDTASETALREAGRRLRDFSAQLARQERADVNRIITASRRGMLLFFSGILVSALLAGPLVFVKILRSLRKVEDLAHSIAEGRFARIEGTVSNDELGSVIRAVNSMSEMLRSRESELLQSKKMASLGTLTAGVAHEITNPLNNISMIAETFETLYDDIGPEERVDFMRKVRGEVERIRQIVVGLLDFSRPKKADQREASINEVVEGTMRLVRNMLDVSNIEVRLDLSPDLPPVFVDENQIHQVLVNIVTNAIQAMGVAGTLSIATRPGGDGFVEVELRDSGKGIPPECLPHVFDPFFSTKGVEGTGLGLSVSYGIIKDHGGRIRAENPPDGGAAFIIELPAARNKENADEHAQDHGH